MIYVDNKNSYRAKIVSLICWNRIQSGILSVIDGNGDRGAYELYYMCARLSIHLPKPTKQTHRKTI